MTYRLIEWLGVPHEAQTTEIGGRTFPLPALVEDDDGIRLMLMAANDDGAVPAHAWHLAHAAGAAAVVGEIGLGEWQFASAELFMQQRKERAGAYTLGRETWLSWTGEPPTYRDIVLASGAVAADASKDPWAARFVHLHTHSEYSPPDGYSKVKELVAAAVADGQPALGLADHGSVAGHVELQKECDEAGIKPVFAIEAYFQNNRHQHDKDSRYAYWHLVLIAQTDVGLRNLWELSSEGYTEGMYDGKPRIDWETLQRYSEGVICTTACLRGPVAVPYLAGREDEARANLARLHDVFGDRLYMEIHTNTLPETARVNDALVRWGREMSIPLLAAVDSHYPCPEDAINHQAMLVLRNKKSSLDAEGGMFADKEDYSMLSTDQVEQALKYLGDDVVAEAMSNTVRVAESCTAKIVPNPVVPTFSRPSPEYPDARAHDIERLLDLCLSNWHKTSGKDYSQETAEARFEEEMRLIIAKMFPGYFLTVADYVNAAKNRDKIDPGILEAIEAMFEEPPGGYKRTPILVGPGRGSGGGSMVAYLAGITEIDPIESDLLFARFLTPGRTELPDFDLDFPASERNWIKSYVRWRWGSDHVVTIGTVTLLRAKGAVREVARIFKDEVEIDYDLINRCSKSIERIEKGLAGQHLDWDDWEEEAEAQELAQRYPDLFARMKGFFGRWRAYGQHPAGVVVDTEKPLTGTLPMRVDKDGNTVTQFDMKALEYLGFVKFDLLTLRTLDTLQVCLDLIYARTGEWINPYGWRDEYRDERVWDGLSNGRTLGGFQIETATGTQMCKRLRPRNVADLAVVITIIRPGPKRSGLTEMYLRRRFGEEAVTFPEPRLEAVLGETFGCIVYQEDVMATTMVLAQYDGNEADGVRKILGKKLVEKVTEAGSKFVERAVANATDPKVATDLWEQMAEFAKYSFNKAHAFGYAVIGHWTMWLKFNYPIEFIAAALSTVDDDRIPEFVSEARWFEVPILPPDINESGLGFKPVGPAIRYGLDGIYGVGAAIAAEVERQQPYGNIDQFIERKACGSDKVVTFVRVGAFDTLHPNRRALQAQLEWTFSKESQTCVSKDESVLGPGGLPCTFDWSSEPIQIGKSGKPLKPKDPPKKCTKACRQYRPPQPVDVQLIAPYTDADIRDIEKELLGVYLSSTPFDDLDPQERQICATVEEIDAGPLYEYVTAGIVNKINPKVDRSNNPYAWIGLETETGLIEAVCFARTWATLRHDLVKDNLLFVVIEKNYRGLSLVGAMPPAVVAAKGA